MGYFYRLLRIGIISACIPIILAGAIYDHYAEGSALRQEQSDSADNLSLVQERMERVMQGIEVNALHLTMNPTISDSFSDPQFHDDLLLHLRILKIIEEEKSNNDLIGDLYLFNLASEIVLSDSYGYVSAGSFKYRNDIRAAMAMKSNAAWMRLPDSSKEGYLSYVRKMPNYGGNTSDGLLVLEVKASNIQHALEDSGSMENQRDVYVLSTQGQFLSGTSPLAREKTEALTSLLSSHPGTQGQFYARDPGHSESLYTFSMSSEGRTYLSVIPRSELFRPINWVRWATTFGCLSLICIGMMLALFYARRAYRPINQLLSFGIARDGRINVRQGNEISFIKECLERLDGEVRSLSQYVKDVKPKVQEQFLQQLLEGSYRTPDSIYRECISHQIKIKANYVVLVAAMGSLSNSRRFHPNDDTLVTFVLKNVMEEVMSGKFALNGYVTHLTSGQGIAVLPFDSSVSRSMVVDSVKQYADTVCSMMEQTLNLNVSVGVGKVYPRILDVPASYREALSALQQRMYMESETAFLTEEKNEPREVPPNAYPRHIEKAILTALQRGHEEEAVTALHEFSQAIVRLGSSQSIYQGFYLLLSAVILSLEKNGVNVFKTLENDWFKELGKCGTIKEIGDWFIHIVFQVYRSESESQLESHSTSAIRSICQYIQEHITQDISLIQCAEVVQMNPSSFSRMFKKETGTGFIEFVTKCKLEEAKRLCLDTDCTLNEIADAVGYSERNLNRMFRRYVQMTPGQFRSVHR